MSNTPACVENAGIQILSPPSMDVLRVSGIETTVTLTTPTTLTDHSNVVGTLLSHDFLGPLGFVNRVSNHIHHNTNGTMNELSNLWNFQMATVTPTEKSLDGDQPAEPMQEDPPGPCASGGSCIQSVTSISTPPRQAPVHQSVR